MAPPNGGGYRPSLDAHGLLKAGGRLDDDPDHFLAAADRRTSWSTAPDDNPAGLSEFALAHLHKAMQGLPDEVIEGTIPLTDEEVLMERDAGLERLARIKRMVSTQEHVARHISAKLSHTADLSEAKRPARSVSNSGPEGGGTKDMKILGSKERQFNARVLFDELQKRQNRTVKFKARREALKAQADQEHEVMLAKLAAADVRWAQRREQLGVERRRKAFTKKQQRTEHQKAVKDNLKDSDAALLAQIEKGHAKHGDAVSRPASQPSLRRPQSQGSQPLPREEAPLPLNLSRACTILDAPPQISPKKGNNLAGSATESVLQDQMRSHALYVNTLDRWSQYVAENDRRTEALWVKMTGAPHNGREVGARRISKSGSHAGRIMADSEDILDLSASRPDSQHRKSVSKGREGHRLSSVSTGNSNRTRENSPDSSPHQRRSVSGRQRKPGESVLSAWLEATDSHS
mmetsp:Transcript_19728/g.45973  ORF Transcript_19728/g.45973 Transcript_19728/m.45973 type:complete len:461 (+) Transcript_19728:37-1419(+)